MNIQIRKEQKSDFVDITRINEKAFGQINEGKLVEKLRENSKFVQDLSLVAILENNVVGHILFFPVNVIHGNKIYQSISLAPMSVLPNLQNSGIGSKLIKAGLNKVVEFDFKSVIVLGHSKYYTKFGFAPASKWGILCPYEVPDEVFMALELVEGELDRIKGFVEYPPEFDEV